MPKKHNVPKSGTKRQKDYMEKLRADSSKYEERKRKDRELWQK